MLLVMLNDIMDLPVGNIVQQLIVACVVSLKMEIAVQNQDMVEVSRLKIRLVILSKYAKINKFLFFIILRNVVCK
jgi:hypothetical protein